MSKNKSRAYNYALNNGELPDTMDFLTTVQDYQCGYDDGFKRALQIEKELEHAKKLLRETYKLPQNQKWNVLYEPGESIRNKITEFLTK